MIKDRKSFFTGLTIGIVSVLALLVIARKTGSGYNPDELPDHVVAQVSGERLMMSEVQKKVAANLIPIENDQYRVLSSAVDDWFENHLFDKEAAEQKISSKELISKEIWGKVQIADADVQSYYNQKKSSGYNQPFEMLKPFLLQELRQKEYQRIKKDYVEKLKKKHSASIYLKKPDSYVESLVSPPTAPTLFPSVPGGALPNPSQVAAQAPPVPIFNFTDLEGKPTQGPKDAPVTLVEFSDFHCPFCSRVEPIINQLMKNYPGKIRRVWRHYPLPFHTGSDHTHEASECAAEQGKFWEYHDKLFGAQSETHDDAMLARLAKEVGADQNKFQACLNSGKYKAKVQSDINKGAQSGVSGTPTIFVNGKAVTGAQPYANFEYEVENILNPGKMPPPPSVRPSQPVPPQAPRPDVNFNDLDGKPTQGPKNAPITLVEFSDFHCPFCARVTPTIAQLMKNYSGKIRRVWRHYPLPFHAGSDRTHEASECAADQGKFWEYHDKVFSGQGGLQDDAARIKAAEEIGLNKKKFEQCLTSGKYKDLIQKEVARGNEVGVDGTPAFFINGQSVSGALPYESFDQIIKSKLKK